MSFHQNRSGFVLVTVMLVLIVLAGLIVEFHFESRVQAYLAGADLESHQALDCAEMGLTIATRLLSQSHEIREDEEVQAFLMGTKEVPIGCGRVLVRIEGEDGKININDLKRPDGTLDRDRIDMLLRLIDSINLHHKDKPLIPYSIVPAMIDWVDRDDDVTILPFLTKENRGAESDYYRRKHPSYPCKNRPFECLGELLRVKGLAETLLPEKTPHEQDEPFLRIDRYLTIYPSERLNINTVQLEILQAVLLEQDEALAESIIDRRPFHDWQEVRQVPGINETAYLLLRRMMDMNMSSAYYTITATGFVNDRQRRIQAVVTRDKATGGMVPVVRWDM